MSANNKIEHLFGVEGMVCVVTGGGSGLGLYAARALDANGAKAVYIVGRREETLQKAAKTGVNGKIIPVVGDVTNKESLTSITDRIRQEQGYVNLLFANAGIIGPVVRNDVPKLARGEKISVKELQEGLWKPDMDTFSKTSHVNVTGVFYTAVAFMDLLDAGNKQCNVPQDSQILVTSSVAGFSRYLNSGVAYSTSKAAVNHLVKMLSTCFATHGFHIRCNLIAPGLYPSEMTEKSVSALDNYVPREGHEGDSAGAHIMPAERCPTERTGSEQDFAGTVLFMASRAGAYLNGETLVSDGGRLAQLPATY